MNLRVADFYGLKKCIKKKKYFTRYKLFYSNRYDVQKEHEELKHQSTILFDRFWTLLRYSYTARASEHHTQASPELFNLVTKEIKKEQEREREG